MNAVDSLYAQYTKEREGAEILFGPHHFITYRIVGSECFIVNMFIAKEHRSSGLCKQIITDIARLAKQAGCEVLTATIQLNDEGRHQTIQAALGCGFKVEAANPGALLIAKKLSEEL